MLRKVKAFVYKDLVWLFCFSSVALNQFNKEYKFCSAVLLMHDAMQTRSRVLFAEKIAVV